MVLLLGLLERKRKCICGFLLLGTSGHWEFKSGGHLEL